MALTPDEAKRLRDMLKEIEELSIKLKTNIDTTNLQDIEKNAKKIENISWAEYRTLIPKEWNPRMNSPFDPIASKIAEEEKITVITMNGKKIDNLAKCLNGEKFIGSVIS